MSLKIYSVSSEGPKENKSHALEKEYEPNVQTEQTKKGRE